MKHSVGQPKKYKTNEELIKVIENYLNETPFEIWTITGLGLSVGLDRGQLINYSKDDKYSYTIKRAKEMIHNSYEVSLRKDGGAGNIFALKNFKWKDKQEVEQTVHQSPINVVEDGK